MSHCPASTDGAQQLCGVSPDTCEFLEGDTVIAPVLIERPLGPEGSCLLHISCGVRTTSGEGFLRLRSVSPVVCPQLPPLLLWNDSLGQRWAGERSSLRGCDLGGYRSATLGSPRQVR